MGILSTERNQHKVSALFEFTQGIAVDQRLADAEIRVQAAWARALSKMGILTADEFRKVEESLKEARSLIEGGKFQWRVEDEDVHMNLERFVTEKHGALGKKMHVGRSRNDLIATTLKLFVSDALASTAGRMSGVISVLVSQAEKNTSVIVPGMTHVQNGQPVRIAQIFLAHAWAVKRDEENLTALSKACLREMPLGSAALAGTSLEIDLNELAKDLGFSTAAKNSYDQVGSRDEMIQGLQTMSLAAVHLSRLAEDCIFWASSPVGLVALPAAWSTGSSIMPNKRNPDVAELVRAKSAHIIGALTNALTLAKGLPTSYASDLHEMKTVFMRAWDELNMSLDAFVPFIEGLNVKKERATQLLNHGHILATEIADELAVKQGIPFREAYGQVASLVESAERLGKQVHELDFESVQKISPKLSREFIQSLSFESAVEKRAQAGGTAMTQVQKQIKELKN